MSAEAGGASELPLLTRGLVLRRAWPLVFANAAIPLASAADTFVLGLAGDASDIGGVALGGAILSIFLWGFIFLRMGTTGLVAQAIGARNEVEGQRVLLRSLIVAAVLGSAVLLLRHVIAAAGLGIMQGEAAVSEKAAGYLTARALGAPAALAFYALTGWLIGTCRTGATFAVAGFFSLDNIGLELWFVLGLHMGPVGVGVATAIADWTALVVALAVVARAIRARGGWAPAAFDRRALFDAAAMGRLLDVNLNLMVRTWFLILGFTWFVNASAGQGAATLADNQVLLQVIAIWAFVLDAFAYVAEAEAGKAFGAKSLPDLRHAVRLTGELALACGAAFAVLTFAFGGAALTALVADAATRDAAIAFLPFCAVVPVLGVPAWILDGVFIGTTRGAMLRNASIASVTVYVVADLLLAPPLGNFGVWTAFLCFYVARAAALGFYYPQLEARMS
ncbi:MATE family efflux transporter [soil metagenome]